MRGGKGDPGKLLECQGKGVPRKKLGRASDTTEKMNKVRAAPPPPRPGLSGGTVGPGEPFGEGEGEPWMSG